MCGCIMGCGILLDDAVLKIFRQKKTQKNKFSEFNAFLIMHVQLFLILSKKYKHTFF